MTPRERRQRGAQESLGAVILGFESVIVFLGGLALYGLKALPAGLAPWWGIVGGVVFAVLMIALSGLLRHRWAIGSGWILQLLVFAAGFLTAGLFVVGIIFGGLWAYAMVKGAQLDRRHAPRSDHSIVDHPIDGDEES